MRPQPVLIIQEVSTRKVFGVRPSVIARVAVTAVAAILLIGLIAPFVNANAFRSAIQSSLEEALGRKVAIENVYFTLFTGPGFTLENVTVDEDPHYGLEPFAFIPTLQLRVRLDKLLLGQIRPQGLNMVDAQLNLVKSDDGTWNAVALVERLGAPRRAPFNFLPAVQISNGRIDFKLGTRKTTLYITETGLSIYPESSGKIYFKFNGSPARTDRAGNGFGRLTGTANWYLRPAAFTGNQLEADVNLQPSNLSELATLFQGQDIGVHGNVSGHVLINGPFSNLHALGEMRFEDVHRWDLLPSPGDNWRVRFRSNVNLNAHTLDLVTLPLDSSDGASASPATLQLRANEFMTHPSWSVLTSLHEAPLAILLPLGRRMGIALPAGLEMDGTLNGVIGFSNLTGLGGGVVITNALAKIPDVPPLRSASANVTISSNTIHIDPTILQTDSGGTLRAGADFNLGTQKLTAGISVDQFSAAAFKETTGAWFGSMPSGSPEALTLIQQGNLTGRFSVVNTPGQKPAWSGQVQFADAVVSIPGISAPVQHMAGKAAFDEGIFDLPHMSGNIGQTAFTGSYRYSVAAKHPEHLRLEIPEADLSQLESVLAPSLSDDSLLSRLPFTRRSIPLWLANRNLEGDVFVTRFSMNEAPLGPMNARFVWRGPSVELASFQIGLATGSIPTGSIPAGSIPAGSIHGSGTISLLARLPRYHLATKVAGYAWGGGIVNADGTLDASGIGLRTLQTVQGAGVFSSQGVAFTGSDSFTALSGHYSFAFTGDIPSLKLSDVEARQNDEDWSGSGSNTQDGKLHLDLTNGDRQLHVVADLIPTEHEAHAAPNAFR